MQHSDTNEGQIPTLPLACNFCIETVNFLSKYFFNAIAECPLYIQRVRKTYLSYLLWILLAALSYQSVISLTNLLLQGITISLGLILVGIFLPKARAKSKYLKSSNQTEDTPPNSTKQPIPELEQATKQKIVSAAPKTSSQPADAIGGGADQFHLVANVPGMIYQFRRHRDGSVSFPYVSKAAKEIYQLEASQIQQNATLVIDLIHPDDRTSFEESVAVSANTLQSWQWEGRFVMSGKIKWLQTASRPQLEANGDILWNGVLMEITEGKCTHTSSEGEQLRAIFEQMGIAMAQVGLNGQFLRVNPKLCELTGYSREELLKKKIFDISHPEDQAVDRMYLRQFLTLQQQTFKLEKRYICRSGELIWVNVTVSVVRDPQGKPLYYIGAIEDITNRKQAQAALQHREEQFRWLIENAPDIITILNSEAKICYASPSVQKIGYKPIDLCGLDIVELVHPEDRSSLNQALTEILQEPRCEKLFKFRFPDQNGSWQTFEALGQSQLDQTGELLIIVNARNITAREDQTFLNRQESVLWEFADQIRHTLERDFILETAVQSIYRLLPIERCHFSWYKPQETELVWEVVQEARNSSLESHLGQVKTAQIRQFADSLLNQQIIQINAVEACRDPVKRQFLLDLDHNSVVLIPLPTKEGFGVITCGRGTATGWDEDEVSLLQAMVAQLAIALDQATLYESAKADARLAKAQSQKLELALNQLQSAQAQLIHSEKMSSLGQLVAGIAHEINNPVNFIHGNLAYASAYFYDVLTLLHLYQEHYPDPAAPIVEQAEMINLNFIATDLPKLLGSMQRGTDRIRSIVMSLRNFSRLDEADMKQADVHEGIENTLLILHHRFKPKGKPEIKIFREYGELPNIECYPGQLNQVFLNILSNAIEAFHYGAENQENTCPAITISTSIIDRSNSYQKSTELPVHNSTKTKTTPSVLIKIADNGPGMSELVKTRLFDPFFTTKPIGQGIGLGLSISYQIVVEHHRGVLTCASIPGQGTQFLIEIPIQQLK